MLPLPPQGSMLTAREGFAAGDRLSRWLSQHGRMTMSILQCLQCVSNEEHVCCPLEVKVSGELNARLQI